MKASYGASFWTFVGSYHGHEIAASPTRNWEAWGALVGSVVDSSCQEEPKAWRGQGWLTPSVEDSVEIEALFSCLRNGS